MCAAPTNYKACDATIRRMWHMPARAAEEVMVHACTRSRPIPGGVRCNMLDGSGRVQAIRTYTLSGMP